MKLLFILGRTSVLAQKEIEAAATILPFPWSSSIVSSGVLMLKLETDKYSGIASILGDGSQKPSTLAETIMGFQHRLGGTVKIGLVIEEDVDDLYASAITCLKEISTYFQGKFSFGLSFYEAKPDRNLGLRLKKGSGQPWRYILPKEGNTLSSAQVYHNRLNLLPKGKGVELMVVNKMLAVTLTVQDVDDYSIRDFNIPRPDPVSGMLPPKLAQIMLNLSLPIETVYDPFCGNGRLLEEAELMGIKAYGSDIVTEKVESSKQNLAWIRERYHLENTADTVWLADATQPNSHPIEGDFAIVSEPYLGKPLRNALSEAEAAAWLAELERTYLAFLKVWAGAGHRPKLMILVFPAVLVAGKQEPAFLYAHLVDRISAIGYDSTVLGSFTRPDSFVVRDIVKLNIR